MTDINKFLGIGGEIPQIEQRYRELYGIHTPQLKEFIISELEKHNSYSDSIAACIFLTQDERFMDKTLRERLARGLLKHAKIIADSNGWGTPLYAALRRYNSLIFDAKEMNEFVYFLNSNRIDVHQTVFQSVCARFDAKPLLNAEIEKLSELAEKTAGLASRYFSPDYIAQGEKAAVALNSLPATTILGDKRAVDYIGRFSSTNWFLEMVCDDFEKHIEKLNANSEISDLVSVKNIKLVYDVLKQKTA